MRLNKNKIFGIAALILFLIGIAIILLGVYVYKEYTIVLTMVGVGFYCSCMDVQCSKRKNIKWQTIKKIIFSMSGVSKTFPGAQKPVLKDIYLSFFYGAKIGILGLNGSGKSTLLKIIAGQEKNFQGDVVFSSDYSVGYLPQEPELDPDKTVIDIVKEGLANTVAVLEEYNAINDQFALPEVYEDADKMQQLMDRQAGLQDQIDALNAWDLDSQLDLAMDALRTLQQRLPLKSSRGRERRRVASAVYCFKSPMFYYSMSLPTTWMPYPCIGWSNI